MEGWLALPAGTSAAVVAKAASAAAASAAVAAAVVVAASSLAVAELLAASDTGTITGGKLPNTRVLSGLPIAPASAAVAPSSRARSVSLAAKLAVDALVGMPGGCRWSAASNTGASGSNVLLSRALMPSKDFLVGWATVAALHGYR